MVNTEQNLYHSLMWLGLFIINFVKTSAVML